MAIINLTMRIPKPAAAGGSDKTTSARGETSWISVGPPLEGYLILRFAEYPAHVCSRLQWWTVWPHACGSLAVCVTLCCHLCDLNTGCEKTRGYVASRHSRHCCLRHCLIERKGRSGQVSGWSVAFSSQRLTLLWFMFYFFKEFWPSNNQKQCFII